MTLVSPSRALRLGRGETREHTGASSAPSSRHGVSVTTMERNGEIYEFCSEARRAAFERPIG